VHKLNVVLCLKIAAASIPAHVTAGSLFVAFCSVFAICSVFACSVFAIGADPSLQYGILSSLFKQKLLNLTVFIFIIRNLYVLVP